MAARPATIQQDCPLEARMPGARILAEHNMTYETCLRAHGRPLDAEFRSECDFALSPVYAKDCILGIQLDQGCLRGCGGLVLRQGQGINHGLDRSQLCAALAAMLLPNLLYHVRHTVNKANGM